ncbi:ribosomal protein S12 methylthiotransferase RimO [Striga asiatica]|uniref:Ribosomal protein S12 methylthiotransferase RimO n=1 Tax=Striga asiatica TaxID=4170 RepID=A0A5A7Q1E3_STRAF|nr:ribosomal protein S12 methylthiotransferase RimO [Striga asiatica]
MKPRKIPSSAKETTKVGETKGPQNKRLFQYSMKWQTRLKANRKGCKEMNESKTLEIHTDDISIKPRRVPKDRAIASYIPMPIAKDAATLRRGMLKSFEMMLKSDTETPAESNSTEPISCVHRKKKVMILQATNKVHRASQVIRRKPQQSASNKQMHIPKPKNHTKEYTGYCKRFVNNGTASITISSRMKFSSQKSGLIYLKSPDNTN